MKTILTSTAAVLLMMGQPGPAQAGQHRHDSHTHTINLSDDDHSHFVGWDDNTRFEVDDGSVIITHKERGEPRSTVEITEDHELYVDDERIALDPDQQALVDRFHDDAIELSEEAVRIGVEGAKIGLQGARLGVEAVAGVFRLLSPGYDSDDLEADMERKAARIEAKASVLEERAEVIEEMAEELEDQAADLRRAIPALKSLDWF